MIGQEEQGKGWERERGEQVATRGDILTLQLCDRQRFSNENTSCTMITEAPLT